MTEIVVNTEEEWDALTLDELPMLVLVTAPAWCVPCRQFEPHWNKAQSVEALEHITFVKIDAGASPEDTGNHWASRRFGVRGVPTLFLVGTDGERTDVKARAVFPLIKELTA